jgi:drug/metabolite transporter (DMT)-like permease
MIGGQALLTLNDTLAKWLSATYPVGEIVALRSGFIVLALGLFLFSRGGLAALKPVRFRNQALRSTCFITSTFSVVTALSLLPLADVVAFTFASPLFIVALAGPLLGEHVVWRRWVAVLLGFAGVLVMARPTPNAFQWAVCIALAATLFSALRDLVTRRISAVESSNLIVWYSMLAAVIAGLLSIAVMPWRLPGLADTGLFAVNAALNGGAHFMMIESYRRAEASIVAPFRYSALLWGISFGFLVWGDVPGVWLLAGAVVVAGSGLYLFYYAQAS